MTANNRTDILFPVGRLVQGSAYTPRDKDAEGKPLVIKNGPDTGKPRVDFYLAVAIPKTAGHTHWSQTEWGQKILAVGAAAFPQAYQSPSFAWKIEDGDSAVPNKKGRRPCDNEGWKGNWVIKLSGGYAPKIFNADGTVQILEPGALKAGYYVQVYGNCAGNGSVSQPGVYLNHSMVAIAGYGPEISSGPDAAAVGFGQGVQLPPGASTTPVAALALPQAAAALPVMPAAPTLVAPNPGFLAPGAAPAALGAPLPLPAPVPLPVMPPPPAGPVMTPKGIASGFTIEQYRQAGYTDEILRAQGLIV